MFSYLQPQCDGQDNAELVKRVWRQQHRHVWGDGTVPMVTIHDVFKVKLIQSESLYDLPVDYVQEVAMFGAWRQYKWWNQNVYSNIYEQF